VASEINLTIDLFLIGINSSINPASVQFFPNGFSLVGAVKWMSWCTSSKLDSIKPGPICTLLAPLLFKYFDNKFKNLFRYSNTIAGSTIFLFYEKCQWDEILMV
jgi:hypothetical protein